MDRDRAEAFLRVLAEAELRRAAARPGDRAVVAGCAGRVMRVAGALTAVRAFGDEITGPVLDDFELALGTRRIRSPAGYGRGLRSWMVSAAPRGAPAGPGVAVPVGQVIPVHGEQVTGAVTLLSYALTASGALLTFAASPGQLAALCARLDVTGHGITAPPARDLPGPWLSVLSQHERDTPRAATARGGCAAVAAALPDLDGVRLSVLGLTSSADGTVLHAHASGMAYQYYGWPEGNLAPAIWIRGDDGLWHATRTERQHEADITMHLQVVPPLSPGTGQIGILLAGQSADVQVTLPVRWQ